MKFKVGANEVSDRFMSIVIDEHNKFIKKTMKNKVIAIGDILKKNIISVIEEYNSGTIERFSGDFTKRQEDNSKYGRNMPLIKTSEYYNTIESVLSKNTMKELRLDVFSNADYSKYLEEGTNKMVGYRVFEIALIRSQVEIDAILKS